MTREELQAIVTPFYNQALTVNATTTPGDVLERILAPGFSSINSQEIKDKATLIKQLGFFWMLIPDLKWEIQDLLVEGNKVAVRSIATGAPKGNFMGMDVDGSKSFKIDTIDIHEVENGQIVRVHHLEDWATAMRQLK